MTNDIVLLNTIYIMEIYQTLEDKKSFFDEFATVETPDEFENEFSKLMNLAKRTKLHVVFRGIPEAKYKLYTSLQRELFGLNLNKGGFAKSFTLKLIENAKKQTQWSNYFKAMGVSMNDWLYLALLQHYGAPSPLLDFSKNPKVALYFMCKGIQFGYSEERINHYASIVYYKNVDVCRDVTQKLTRTALDIYKHAEIKSNNDVEIQNFIRNDLSFEKVMQDNEIEVITAYKKVASVRIDKNVVFSIPMTNMNMVSQEGEFVCNISDNQPIEVMFTKEKKRYLSCLNIHKSLFTYIVNKYFGGSLEQQSKMFFPSDKEIAARVKCETLAHMDF